MQLNSKSVSFRYFPKFQLKDFSFWSFQDFNTMAKIHKK